jgi:predicted SnoaL-like aldol condensation-catalyzing enzyme
MHAVATGRLWVLGAATLVVSGCTTATLFEQELTQTNTQTVLAFEETVFNKHEVAEAFQHYVADSFVEHDRELAGVRGEAARGEAQGAYGALIAREGARTHRDLERSIAQGDLVATQSSWTRGSGPQAVAVVDIYRLSAGRIVEHWDVIGAQAALSRVGENAVPGETLPP